MSSVGPQLVGIQGSVQGLLAVSEKAQFKPLSSHAKSLLSILKQLQSSNDELNWAPLVKFTDLMNVLVSGAPKYEDVEVIASRLESITLDISQSGNDNSKLTNVIEKHANFYDRMFGRVAGNISRSLKKDQDKVEQEFEKKVEEIQNARAASVTEMNFWMTNTLVTTAEGTEFGCNNEVFGESALMSHKFDGSMIFAGGSFGSGNKTHRNK
ncbi:hypothetical protein C8J56DRAFT_143939 [Mycena floridula]|nr:hypothetical protein C8J56DRAFT_143939 [Mycena floridula]